jgi:hypothetical protein
MKHAFMHLSVMERVKRKVLNLKIKVKGEIKGENVGMISPPSGPTATWALGHAP